jgi:hypothetical protein
MFLLKLIGKILLIPVLIVLFVLNIAVAVIGGIYGVIHGLFWVLMIFAVILAALFGMWPQAIAFAIFMGLSLIVIQALNGLAALLGGAMGMVAALLTA